MSFNLSRMLLEDFLDNSRQCVETISRILVGFKGGGSRKVRLFSLKKGRRNERVFDGGRFFLRTSVEYSNPHLTVEEVQGVIAARMLEVCCNYLHEYGTGRFDSKDLEEMCERLSKPPQGLITPFLLNTDDAEPDRYSMNPLKGSIVESGQSAFPSASVTTEGLCIDEGFMRKYEGSLISRGEAELIERFLESGNNNYLDMVDAVKYEQLNDLSESFGIDLRIHSLRMPLALLKNEGVDGLLHHIISESHTDYDSIKHVYGCMGRSMKKRRTLLTVIHSGKGFGSKRAARGRIYFDGEKLKGVKVTYKTSALYPNAIDPDDVSIAKADDSITVEGNKLNEYDFKETPSSPQFVLYALGSPENAAIWHGIGGFGASQLVKSYTTTRLAFTKGSIIKDLKDRHGFTAIIPLQLNIPPMNTWFHPIHRNIDASIGSIEDLNDLAREGVKVEHIPTQMLIRKPK